MFWDEEESDVPLLPTRPKVARSRRKRHWVDCKICGERTQVEVIQDTCRFCRGRAAYLEKQAKKEAERERRANRQSMDAVQADSQGDDCQRG